MAKAKDKPVEVTLDNLLTKEAADVIRKAFNAGRRTIMIEGRKFLITKRQRRVTFQANGESHKATESWLNVRPSDGALVPTAQVELKYQGNMRTVRDKS